MVIFICFYFIDLIFINIQDFLRFILYSQSQYSLIFFIFDHKIIIVFMILLIIIKIIEFLLEMVILNTINFIQLFHHLLKLYYYQISFIMFILKPILFLPCIQIIFVMLNSLFLVELFHLYIIYSFMIFILNFNKVNQYLPKDLGFQILFIHILTLFFLNFGFIIPKIILFHLIYFLKVEYFIHLFIPFIYLFLLFALVFLLLIRILFPLFQISKAYLSIT